MPNIYTGGYVVIDDTADTVLGGITQQNIATGIEVERMIKSGELYPRVVSLAAVKPTFGFTGKSINTYIDAFGVFGYNIATPASGVKSFLTQCADGAGRTAGSNHISYTFNAGIIAATSLSASGSSAATIDYTSVLTYDGSNAPVVPASGVALPTAPDETEFVIGDWTVESVAISGLESVSIDFGVQVEGIALDGDYYNTISRVVTISPTIRLSGVNVELLLAANIPLTGKMATQANTTGYFRKRAPGVGYVADGTAEHIKINSAGVAHVENVQVASEGAGRATADLVLSCYYDGTNLPLVIDTTSAIS